MRVTSLLKLATIACPPNSVLRILKYYESCVVVYKQLSRLAPYALL